MGTNFYHRTRSGFLGLFGYEEEKHIGKRSGGWLFSFRGYKDNEGRPIIVSWQDWKRALKKGKIFDEYGEQYSYAYFVVMVEQSRKPGSLNHYDYVCNDPRFGPAYLQDDWKDADGWSFSATEFC